MTRNVIPFLLQIFSILTVRKKNVPIVLIREVSGAAQHAYGKDDKTANERWHQSCYKQPTINK